MVKRQEVRKHEGGYSVLHVKLDDNSRVHPLLVKKSDSGVDTLFVTHL